MKKNHYFVSFSCKRVNEDGTRQDGFGNADIKIDFDIESMEDVELVQETIKEQYELEDICIINWRKF